MKQTQNKAIETFVEFVRKKYQIELPVINDEEFAEQEYIKYTRTCLSRIQASNKPTLTLRVERQRIRDDLDDLERCFVSSPSYDGIGTSFDNGYKPNTEYNRQIEKQVLKEKLKQKVIECRILEEQLEEQNKIVADLIDAINYDSLKESLKNIFIYNLQYSEIALALNCEIATIKTYRHRGISVIAMMIMNFYLKKSK